MIKLKCLKFNKGNCVIFIIFELFLFSKTQQKVLFKEMKKGKKKTNKRFSLLSLKGFPLQMKTNNG